MTKDLVNRIVHGDCLQVMNNIDDKSIDMILADLPYERTNKSACVWDVLIPFEPLWSSWKRILKDSAPVVLTAREPFTSLLVASNINWYKHKWVWNKKQSGSFQNAKYMPLQIEEDVIVFCENGLLQMENDIVVFGAGRVNFYPIMRTGRPRKRGGADFTNRTAGKMTVGFENYGDQYYPVNIIELANPRRDKLHPVQKPVELFEYLIKTYTREGDLILDNCIGSGTTAEAALNSGRRFIGIEKDLEFCQVAEKRIRDFQKKKIAP